MEPLSMHSPRVLTLLTVLLIFCGCSNDAPAPAPAAGTPAVSPESPTIATDSTTPSAEQPAPDFDPKLTLDWPGTPQESRRRIDAGSDHETTIYRATFSQTDPIIMFEANVSLMSEKDLQESDLKELLASQGTWDEHQELTRTQIEFGPNKHPGCKVTGKVGDTFVRRLTVLAGRKLYALEVACFKPERLNAADVVKWFESFAITK